MKNHKENRKRKVGTLHTTSSRSLFAVAHVLPSSQLLSHFDNAKHSGFSNFPPLKQNKERVPWQHKFELQCKTNMYYRIVDLSFDTKTLTNSDDREVWNKQCYYVNLLFNNHIKTSLAKMINNDDSVKDRPHLIWQNLVAYYEDYTMARSNTELIAIGFYQLHTSQFNSRMDFLAKFVSKIDRYNDFSVKKMSHSTCISHLNRAISEDKILNTEVKSIKINEQHPRNTRNKTGQKLNRRIKLIL